MQIAICDLASHISIGWSPAALLPIQLPVLEFGKAAEGESTLPHKWKILLEFQAPGCVLTFLGFVAILKH